MSPGQIVLVKDYEGKLLKRMVVDTFRDAVLVCKADEYQVAKEYKSLPWCVGFKKANVLPAETHPSKVKVS